MSVCKTDALAAWLSERRAQDGVAVACYQEWCTRKDLNLHAVAAAASEAAASTVSPRVHCQELIDGAATADRTPVSAVPKRCPATGRLRPRLMEWCWLEDSNLPPLAYKASALPDELSQLRQLTNGSRRRSRSGSDLVGAPRLGAASEVDLHNVKERGAAGALVTGVRTHGSTVRTNARAPSAHEMSFDVLRLVLRAICPPALAAEGNPAPVIPVSVSSLARTD
jgi:hypothetical protein